MTEYFLPTDTLKGTRATPYAVYGGKVHSFKVNVDAPAAINGTRLMIRDGRMYARFETDVEAMNNEKHFPGCERIGMLFDLGEVVP